MDTGAVDFYSDKAPVVIVDKNSSTNSQTEALLKLQARNPGTRWVKIEKTPIAGIFKATAESGKTVFIDSTVSYLLLGVIVDLNTGKFIENASELNKTGD